MSALDLAVSFPSRGVIRLQSRSLFGDVEAPTCRRFLERVLRAAEITGVTIRGGRAPHADLRFRAESSSAAAVVRRVAAMLRQDDLRPGPSPPDPATARDRKDVLRYFRHESVVTGWEIRLDRPGRLKLRNRVLDRRAGLCRAIERELMTVLGVDRCWTNALTCVVGVDYDPDQLSRRDVIRILDGALAGAGPAGAPDRPDWHLPFCTAVLPIAAAAEFAVPPLLPLAAGLLACASILTLREAHRALFRDRRPGVAVLDSVVILGCLGTAAVFPGALLCWGTSFGRKVAERTRDNSRKLLLGAFGKQPRHARLYRDGIEVRVPVERLHRGDLVVVDAGEVVPVDGEVVAGLAMIDPEAVTGSVAPVERGAGDRLLASTLVLGGRAYVSVEAVGGETTAATIGRMLHDAAAGPLSLQRRAERLADLAVAPTLALGAIGMAALGPGAALAVLNRDVGSGLGLAGPPTMLGAVALCAHRGIAIRDIRALERMSRVDTILLGATSAPGRDQTGYDELVRGLHRRGIRQVIALPDRDEAEIIARLQAEGRTVCFVGDSPSGQPSRRADVVVSLRGPSSIAIDAADVVLLEDDLALLGELREIARDLDRNVKRSGWMTVVPNLAGLAGIFAMGLGVTGSVVVNNLAALAALAIGVLPLGEVARLEAGRRHRREMNQAVAAGIALPCTIDTSSPTDPFCQRSELATAWAAAYHGDGCELGNGAPTDD